MKDAKELLKVIDEDAKKMLSEKRYIHCKNVMKRAVELARMYGVDEDKAMLTGFAHDIAKEIPTEEYYKYAKENNIELSKDDIMCTSVLHGIIGADIVKKKYGFTDEMCRAIYYHTTGIINMTTFEKIIFLADKVEERTRPKDKADVIRNIIKEKGLDEAILWIADDYTIPKAIKNRSVIHPNTINVRNEIIEKMNTQKLS